MALFMLALASVASAQLYNGGSNWNQNSWNQPTGTVNQPSNQGNSQSGSVSQSTLPMTIDKVEVDGTTLSANQDNRLSIERDQEFKVKVTFTGTASHENIVLQGFISGYEHVEDSPYDAVDTFDIEDDTTYTKTLTLKLPKDIQEDSYKLRLLFTDRNGQEISLNYNLKIDESRHSVEVKDIILYPENSITAGSALLTTVRVENFGQKDENDVKVQVSIPALGLSASDYIDSIKQNDEEETEELYLRIPRETKAGDYDMLVTISYNDEHDTVESHAVVHVDADEAYTADVTPKTAITVGSQLENVKQGEQVMYPLTITNTGKTDVAYTVAVSGASDWADVTVNPTSTQIIKAGESKTFYVSMLVKDDASAGSHVFTATVSTGSTQIEQLAMTTNVLKSSHIWATIGKVIGVLFIAAIVVLVILGILVGYNRMKGDEPAQPQTYY